MTHIVLGTGYISQKTGWSIILWGVFPRRKKQCFSDPSVLLQEKLVSLYVLRKVTLSVSNQRCQITSICSKDRKYQQDAEGHKRRLAFVGEMLR